MKRIISIALIICTTMACFAYIPFEVNAENGKCSVTYQKFCSEQNGSNPLNKLEEGSLYAVAEFLNETDSDISASLVVLLYKNSVLENIVLKSDTILKGIPKSISTDDRKIEFSVAQGSSLSDYELKLMTVEDINTFMPVADLLVMNSSNIGTLSTVVKDDFDNNSLILEKTPGLWRVNHDERTYRSREWFNTNVMRGDNDTSERHIAYALDSTKKINKITAAVYYYDNGGYCGAPEGATDSVRLDYVLDETGLQFRESDDNNTYTNAENVYLNRYPSNEPGLMWHEVIYEITGIKNSSEFFRVVFPAIINGHAWAQHLDWVKFEYIDTEAQILVEPTPTPTPTPTITPTVTPTPTPTDTPTPTPDTFPYVMVDDMNNKLKMYSSSDNVNCYNENVKTDTYRDNPYSSMMARRDGNNVDSEIIYAVNDDPLSRIVIDAYYYDNYNYAGLKDKTSSQQRLDAILNLEGIRFLQSTDNVTYTEVNNYNRIDELSPWPGMTAHHVTYVINSFNEDINYFKIFFPGNPRSNEDNYRTFTWSTRVDRVQFEYASGGDGTGTGNYGWVNAAAYPWGKISVVEPSYTSIIDKQQQEIVICAPGFTSVQVQSWLGGGWYGSMQTVAQVELDSRGVGGFMFPASNYQHGPIVVNINGYYDRKFDECSLQLYNKAGFSWKEGLQNEGVPDVVYDMGLVEVFKDDFTEMPTISWSPNKGRKYSSHKPGWGDFSGLHFTNPWDEEHSSVEKDPFSQIDTYFRIRANQNQDSTGLISSLHQDRKGFAVKLPAYFECKFIAQNAKGTWPAFWLMTTPHYTEWESNPYTDELDIIEAYGFDPSQPQYGASGPLGYEIARHNWGWDVRIDSGKSVNQTNIGGGGRWWTNFHTYGCLITETDTIYYCDNIEVWRHETMETSKTDYIYWMFNLAVGGISGWPYDLTRYNGLSDMYVDWVRVYGLEENVMR